MLFYNFIRVLQAYLYMLKPHPDKIIMNAQVSTLKIFLPQTLSTLHIQFSTYWEQSY